MIQLKIRSRKGNDTIFVEKLRQMVLPIIRLLETEALGCPMVLSFTELKAGTPGILVAGGDDKGLMDALIHRQDKVRKLLQ